MFEKILSFNFQYYKYQYRQKPFGFWDKKIWELLVDYLQIHAPCIFWKLLWSSTVRGIGNKKVNLT